MCMCVSGVLGLTSSYLTWKVAVSRHPAAQVPVCLHKILFHDKASSWESTILLLNPSPPAKHTLLQYFCMTIAQYTPPPPTPPLNATHRTILAMAISCKGQEVVV